MEDRRIPNNTQSNAMEEDIKKQIAQDSKEKLDAKIQELMGLDEMFSNFIAAETEGMIICDNCYDNVFDDDENICQCDDEEGNTHYFCSRECMEEWKKQ